MWGNFVLLPAGRWLTTVLTMAIAAAPACSRQIEEEPPIPEHRFEPCETWCSMLFDPDCPPTDFEVRTEEECVEGCTTEEVVWAPVDGHDECAATFVPFVECMASLPCGELQQHFALALVVPAAERSSCGGLARAQLDCQSAHY